MDGDWLVTRLPLHSLDLINEVNDRVRIGWCGGARPLEEVELSHNATLLRLSTCVYVCAFGGREREK